MSGRPSQNKMNSIRLIVILLIGTVSLPVFAADGPIAVFLSADEEAYKRPVEVFLSQLERPAETFNLEGDIRKGKKIMSDILSKKPSLIFALGAKASYIAKITTLKQKRQDIPIVFARVINWQRYKLTANSENVAGIAAEVDPGTQIFNMRMFAPNVQKIGVVYSKHSTQIIERAKMVTAMLGIEIVARKIKNPDEFKRAYEAISNDVQAYWILQDPVVFTVENMNWLVEQSIKKKIITLGQSENIAIKGSMLAVTIDEHNIGVQAASIANNVLTGDQKPKDVGVMAPLGTKIFLNMKTANSMGIKISEEAKNTATEILE